MKQKKLVVQIGDGLYLLHLIDTVNPENIDKLSEKYDIRLLKDKSDY